MVLDNLILNAYLNQISEVRFSQHSELVIIIIESNRIHSLNVSLISGLRRLECQKNPLDSIELIRIANDIRDCRIDGPNSWGSVTYSHEVPEANFLLQYTGQISRNSKICFIPQIGSDCF